MDSVDFKNKFWPSSHDGVQRFIMEIKNQLILVSNIRTYIKKRCKLYEVFLKDCQKLIPSKEELIIESCQPYSTFFLTSLNSEIKKLNKLHVDGLHAIEMLDKADQAYATFKEKYNKPYSQLIAESSILSSLNNNIGILIDSYKRCKGSFQEEFQKEKNTVDKQLKKIVKDLSHSIEKREKARVSFISLVEDIIPPLKTLATTVLDSIENFFHVWITITVDFLIVSEDKNEIQNAVKTLSTVETLEKMLAKISSRGYPPRKIQFNPDSPEDPLILEDGTKADNSEFVSTKYKNVKRLNSLDPMLAIKKPSDNKERQKSIQPSDNDNISHRDKSHTSLHISKNTTNAGVEAMPIPNLNESLDVINEQPKHITPKLEQKSFFYPPTSSKPEEKAKSRGFDSDEDKDKKTNSFDDSDGPDDEPIRKFNIVIKPGSSNPSLPQTSMEAPKSLPVIVPPSLPTQFNLANRRNQVINPNSQDKNIINNPIFGNSDKKAVSSNTNVSNTSDHKDLFPSSTNLFAKPNEELSTSLNAFGSTPMLVSKSSDQLSSSTPTSSQPKAMAPIDDLFPNSVNFSTKINSQTSNTKEESVNKTDNSAVAENSASSYLDDYFSDKNKNPSTSYDMSSVPTHPTTENDLNLKTVDLLTTHNDMEVLPHSNDPFSKELDHFSGIVNSQLNLSNSDDTKKYSVSFKINEILSGFTKQQMTKYSLKGSVTFSLSDEDVQTLAAMPSLNFPKLSFAITHNDTITNIFSSANTLVEKTFKNEKSNTIFTIDEAEFMLNLNKFLKERKSDHFSDIPLLNYEISSPKFSVKPYSITIEPPLIEEKKIILCVSIICAPLDAWCSYYPEFSAVSKNAIVTLAANRIRSKSPLRIESLLPTNKYKWSPEASRLKWVIRELISNSKTSLSVSNYQFKITISSESKIDLDDKSKKLGVAIAFNLDDTLVSSKNITISDTSMFCLNNTQRKLSSGAYLTEI